jgi:hypothetical protein
MLKFSIFKLKLFYSQNSGSAESLEPQMSAIHSLLAYIFDRKAALLPGTNYKHSLNSVRTP